MATALKSVSTVRKDEGFAKQDLNNRVRLSEQLTVDKNSQLVKTAKTIHQKRALLEEIAFYPQHDARKETPQYKKVHDDLTKKKNLPCLVCGVRNSTLHDPKENPYGAKQMETHHHVIEWALANAIDRDRFNKTLRPNLAHRHPNEETYQRNMSDTEIAAWVDHSPDNLWVLCDVHHRSKFFGIHAITFPIWGPVDLLKPDFEDYVRQQLKQATAEEKAAKKKTTKGKSGKAKKSARKKKRR